MDEPRITQAELAVLEAMLPDGLTPDMRDVAQCLFVALVLNDPRCGEVPTLINGWGAQLHAWALQALMQLQYLASQIGGGAVYLAKGITVHLTARDRKMCAEFRGDYKALARKYNLTDMRVRQIVDTFLKAQYLSRQQGLPGLD
jgi:hypothetical protein